MATAVLICFHQSCPSSLHRTLLTGGSQDATFRGLAPDAPRRTSPVAANSAPEVAPSPKSAGDSMSISAALGPSSLREGYGSFRHPVSCPLPSQLVSPPPLPPPVQRASLSNDYFAQPPRGGRPAFIHREVTKEGWSYRVKLCSDVQGRRSDR